MDAAIRELYERGHELKIHIRGAPAAMESFRLAKEVFKEAGI